MWFPRGNSVGRKYRYVRRKKVGEITHEVS